MEQAGKRTTYMLPTSFIAEIVLVLLGLSGVAVIGVSVAYAPGLLLSFTSYSFAVGILTTSAGVAGLYVLLCMDYRALKFYLTSVMFFLVAQALVLTYMHVFATKSLNDEEERGSLVALDVAACLTLSTFVVLCVHARHKGSTIEMVKL